MNAEHNDVLTRGAEQRRAHRSPDRPRTAGAAFAVGAVIVIVLALTAGLAWGGLWPRITGIVTHHLDTVIATVLLAGSLGVVWRLGEEDH